jgi:hypothetical protein
VNFAVDGESSRFVIMLQGPRGPSSTLSAS